MADGAAKNGFELWLGGIMPTRTFAANGVPPLPDYGDQANWAALPQAMGAAAMVPEGQSAIDPAVAEADVFYVHPTTYVGTGNWNEDISGPASATRAGEIVDHLVIPGHASLFNGCCRIFAPRYRQATLAAFFRPGQDGRAALELAYSDVARAFQYYINHENAGRPFILAGHSQGCALLMRLLAADFDPLLKPRLIAAYLLGYKVTSEVAASFSHVVTLAEGRDDTGVFISYDSFLDGVDAFRQSDHAEHWLPSGWAARAGKDAVSVNPVNWSRTKPSALAEHAGFVMPVVNRPELVPALYMPGPDQSMGIKCTGLLGPALPGVAAHIDAHGFLKVSLPEQKFMNEGIFGGNYHNRDVALFYMNLRANIERRVRSFCASFAQGAGG